MKRKNTTRSALFMSVISMLLCVSMLVGTTFAWFTDEVVTGMNTIAAGNLDVELLADGVKVESNTKLFDDVAKWEPGMVAYEKLQVANVGTLALKYQMTLNFGNENDLNGHKLSEVLKVAVLKANDVANWNDRAAVLTAAKAAVAADQGVGALSNFYEVGELEAGVTGDAMYVVIFWAPNDNATDNLYNANNGQKTSDGEPLHIEFGINLQATQKMSENDSFGNDYDEPAAILPKATVNNTGAKTVPVMTGYNEPEIALDTSFQFLPNETEDEGAASDYADWHADYVIVADKDVPANSVALAGYYEAWCGNNGWVVLTGPAVGANQEVRLVAGMLNGTTVSYEEICQYGNDGIGFLCGAADLTGENVGTTITVELRMYETDETLGSLSTTASETGHYEVIGTISYTFGGSYVTLPDGSVLLNEYDGDTVLTSVANVAASDYTVPEDANALAGGVFAGNTNITSVTVPASVTDFGATGVSDTGASGGAFKGSAVTSVVLEEGMTEIPAAAFNGAKNLTSVNIPSTVTTVGVNAFRQTAVTELTIPATVTNINAGAFRDMSALTTVTVEGNVVFANYAFRSVPNLTSIYLLGDDVTINGGQFACHSDNGDATGITIYVKNATVAARVYAAQTSAYGYEVKILGNAADGSDASEVTQVKNDTQLADAITAGASTVVLGSGTYTFPSSKLGEGVTLYCDSNTVFEGNSKLNINGATVVGATFSNPSGTVADQTINGTFKDCTFTGSNALRWCYAGDTVVFENCVFSGDVYGVHFDGGATEVTFKNCTFSGFNATAASIEKITFEGCTFEGNGKSSYNGINLWGNCDFENCTFVFDGSSTYEWIDLCSADKTATFTNCVVDNGSTTVNVSTILGNELTKRETSGKIIIDGVEVFY